MKAAPVVTAVGSRGTEQALVHTGQHYDDKMSQVFFEELGLPRPDVNLGVGSGSHAYQISEVMKRVEPVMEREKPDLVLVYGDVNSTVAAALVACKMQIPVGHVEAGLRSFDRSMPEEINRVLTDQISDLLFTHSPEANENLAREGVDPEGVHFVGNVMIDTLVRLLPKARKRQIHRQLQLTDDAGHIVPYVLVTLHRPCNVDEPHRLRRIMSALEQIGKTCMVLLPLHPRTRERLSTFAIDISNGRIKALDPMGYLDFLCLEDRAAAVVTDSGGIQEETTYLGIRCFTVRTSTERPVTVTQGTNRLIGNEIDSLAEAVLSSLGGSAMTNSPPEFWDGKASERIAEVLLAWHD